MDELQNLEVGINGRTQGRWKAIFVDQKYKVQCVFCSTTLTVQYDHRDRTKATIGNLNIHYNDHSMCNEIREAMKDAGGGAAPTEDPVDRYAK